MIDRGAFFMGWHMGQMIRGMRGRADSGGTEEPEQTPIAYLYNGEERPALPERDEKKYPYVWMFPETLYLLDKPYMRATGDTGGDCFAINGQKGYGETVSGIPYDLSDDGKRWNRRLNFGGYVEWKEIEALQIFTITAPLWTNYDVINVDDNSVYFAASEPVPVYGPGEQPEDTIVATFADSVLYIKNAPAIFVDGILEVK